MDTFMVTIGIVCAALITMVALYIIGKAETRPIRQNFIGSEGFYGGATNGTSRLPCGRVSSEAEQLYGIFSSMDLSAGEEGSTDLHDLKNLLSKITCLKADLMSPGQTITAVKELGFATHMDIQPVADLTARCFSKILPERDLDIQITKWSDFGLDMIKRLSSAGNLPEGERQHAEKLLKTVIYDIDNISKGVCIAPPPKDPSAGGRLEPKANTPEQLVNLRPYDGLY